MQKVIGGQLVNYEVVGPTSPRLRRGKVWDLLILHGWGGSLQEWRSVAENLSQKYRVWSLDFPGFGGSPKPANDWGIYEYANFVNDFIQEFKIKDPIVMGHSFGGRVAILLDAKKIILVDAAGLRIETSMAAVSGLIFDKMGFIKKYVPTSLKNLFGSADYKSAGSMKKIFVKTVSQDLSDEMKKVTCPTLITWGEKDLVLPIVQAKIIKSLVKNSILRIVWGGDHWPHLSKPKEFLEILNEYI